ncbi:predicted protein [Nematostella vectensis]|uniref:Proteasomal ATPase-associated factor 1 n=1 Tax=Nematostella vectensis TaxID=45351 RepID=A7RPH0_NEMVE|nr:predicted protein [Nematostella vectensis]|eukprot:XP_001638747.1 predicted protein [Nematostella vectensis]
MDCPLLAVDCINIATGQPSVYGFLRRNGDAQVSTEKDCIQGTDGFAVTALDKRSITVAFPHKKVSTKFISSSNVFTTIHKKSIKSIDVSSGGNLCVTAADDDPLTIWNTDNGSIRHQLSGHIADVNCCRFFPSGEVIASGGADFQIKIWSAIDGSCPVSLRGHTGGITDISFVERGRNIVCDSRDGSARLWDCGTSSCLATVYKCDCPINACSVGENQDLTAANDQKDEREVGTSHKLLLLARDDGILAGVNLGTREKLFEFQAPSAMNCCAFLSERAVVAGTDDGHIWLLDVRNTSLPIAVFRRSKSPIISVIPIGERGLLASTGDGSCFSWTPRGASMSDACYVTWELMGPDCDPVYKICRHGNTVYTACRDKAVRKYILDTQEMTS